MKVTVIVYILIGMFKISGRANFLTWIRTLFVVPSSKVGSKPDPLILEALG